MAQADDEQEGWVKELFDRAPLDPEVARVLEGTSGDPELITRNMERVMSDTYDRIISPDPTGEDRPVQVSFRSDHEAANVWVWLELYSPPSSSEADLLQEVVRAWFLVGRLGGFNSQNMQLVNREETSFDEVQYDEEEAAGVLPASMHDFSDLQIQGSWVRFWVDMGSADELALDVLINCLTTFSREQVGIKQVVFGGENDDWELPEDVGPQVTMDPMRGPEYF